MINPLDPIYNWEIDGKMQKYSFNPKSIIKINSDRNERQSSFQLNDIGVEKRAETKKILESSGLNLRNTNYIGDILGA